MNRTLFLPRLLVFFQFAALFIIMFSGPLIASNILLKLVQVSSAIIGIWAIIIMHIGNFNIVPIPVKNAVFVTKGPYRLIRHPMYTSLFLFTLPELIGDFSYIRLLAFAFMAITLLYKLRYEEKLLLEKFDEYEHYMTKTKRIIPYIF